MGIEPSAAEKFILENARLYFSVPKGVLHSETAAEKNRIKNKTIRIEIQSLHKINQHNNALFITTRAIIAKELEDGSFGVGTLIQAPQNPMKKRGNAPDLHALFDDITLLDDINPPPAFFRAISLHHGALESKDISNQLLNLWTIIEILIDSKRDNEDRINTICTMMCSILNRRYLYANIEQLLHDVEACSGYKFKELIQDIEFAEEDLDPVEKFALVLSLKEFSHILTALKESLSECPLLKYRITYFSDFVLVDSKSIFEYLKRHEKRIRWHIMRIYRNRNMIVHNGSYMPYRNIIVENLHFYVDVLFDTLIEYYHLGLMSHLSIYKNITDDEMSHYIALGIHLTGQKKPDNIQLTAENALDLIFNGYSGNTIRKAIDRMIERRSELAEIEEAFPAIPLTID